MSWERALRRISELAHVSSWPGFPRPGRSGYHEHYQDCSLRPSQPGRELQELQHLCLCWWHVFSIGPVIGGYLTSASWRYCFVLPIPITVIASLVLYFVLRKELVTGTHSDAIRRREHGSLASAFSTIDFVAHFSSFSALAS